MPSYFGRVAQRLVFRIQSGAAGYKVRTRQAKPTHHHAHVLAPSGAGFRDVMCLELRFQPLRHAGNPYRMCWSCQTEEMKQGAADALNSCSRAKCLPCLLDTSSLGKIWPK